MVDDVSSDQLLGRKEVVFSPKNQIIANPNLQKGALPMRGSVRKDSSSWYFVVDLGLDPVTGRRKQKKKRGFATKREAETALAQLISDYERGAFVSSEKITVEEFLRQWLEDKQSSVRKSTSRSYNWLVTKHISPNIGKIPLSKLSPIHLQRLYADLQRLEQPLSKRSILHLHLVLHEALERALKWGLVVRNVTDSVDPPKPQKVRFQVWSKHEVQRFLQSSKDDRYFIAFLLALSTGMRKGEILGLRWQDVNFEKNILSVRQTLSYTGKGSEFEPPKTEHSTRAIALPSHVVKELKRHRSVQAQEKLLLGSEYQDNDLVVATHFGTFVTARNLDRSWYSLREKAGVTAIRFHDLRHTHASLLLLAGVHPKVVSERLGHANIGITLDLYSHILPGLQEAAAEQFNDLVFSQTE